MIYRFQIDNCWFGSFGDRESIHKFLLERGLKQVSPDSDTYGIYYKGILTGVGEVVVTLPVKDALEIPEK